MGKRLIVAIFVITLVFVCLSDNAFASSACGAELCLTDYKAGTKVKECTKEIDAFFKIKARKHHHFSPSRTYRARRKYIYSCDSGNTKGKESILAAFGYLPSKP